MNNSTRPQVTINDNIFVCSLLMSLKWFLYCIYTWYAMVIFITIHTLIFLQRHFILVLGVKVCTLKLKRRAPHIHFTMFQVIWMKLHTVNDDRCHLLSHIGKMTRLLKYFPVALDQSCIVTVVLQKLSVIHSVCASRIFWRKTWIVCWRQCWTVSGFELLLQVAWTNSFNMECDAVISCVWPSACVCVKCLRIVVNRSRNRIPSSSVRLTYTQPGSCTILSPYLISLHLQCRLSLISMLRLSYKRHMLARQWSNYLMTIGGGRHPRPKVAQNRI